MQNLNSLLFKIWKKYDLLTLTIQSAEQSPMHFHDVHTSLFL